LAGGLIRRHSPGNRRPPPKPNIEEGPTCDDFLVAKEKFQGAYLGTGAQHTFIGKPQAEMYMAPICKEAELETVKELTRHRLGGCTFDTLGAVSICLPIAEAYFFPPFVNFTALILPFLLGLDIIDQYRLYVNNLTDLLLSVNKCVAVPVVSTYGHIYLDWGSDILYTCSEPHRIHKHFYYAKPERLYALIRRSRDAKATPGTLRQLESVAEACYVCQRLSKEPSRFRVSVPTEDLCFNRRVMIDLLTLEQTPVLHVVDRETLFSAAAVLHNRVSSKSEWDAFLGIWVAGYAGYPEQLHADQGNNLQSDEWKQMLRGAEIKPIDSGVEIHNSHGASERYLAMLRQIYRTVRVDHSSIPLDVALSLAVWATNQRQDLPESHRSRWFLGQTPGCLSSRRTYPVTVSAAKPFPRREPIWSSSWRKCD